ncbi:MOSC domain-containing protein [Thioalkalicoccus limnaeus]|uniref:MOSC domain-containing protein n=1 Tax=Thioalkalicoccus limnaeus TaxID=120681 RepID=A0ABV4BLQ5_9GAMM
MPKNAVERAKVTINGVSGDKQRDLRHHGGPQRAVSLFSLELIEALKSEGHPIAPGTTGENLTISGLDWAVINVGDQLRVGEWVELEITGFASPCAKIAESFKHHSIKRISQKVHPGWSRLYTRVITEGVVQPGDMVIWQGDLTRA